MARRRSFSKDDHRSNARSKSRGPRPVAGLTPRQNRRAAKVRIAPARPEASGAPHRNADTGSAQPGKLERVQKVLAHAGLGSRRGCEALIVQGRVSIDGAVVRQLGTRVDPARSRITVDGEPIRLESMVYYAVNKPKGYVSTNSDPSGRPRVVDLLPEIPERVYTVGRLDEDSTGLMILTNDGELANRLAHPRYGVEKLYRALVAGLPGPEMLAKLTEGIWLSDGKVRAKRARIVGRQGQATLLELVLAEGKKREIRRMLSKLGHKVMSLNRVAVGPISLKGLSAGQCRPLSRHEIDLLRKVASGIAIPLPRFSDEGYSTRPPRGSHRGHKAQPQPNQPARDGGNAGAAIHHAPPGGRERRPAGAPDHPRKARPPRPRHGGPSRPDRPIPRSAHDRREGTPRPPGPKIPPRPSSHSRPAAPSSPLAAPGQPTSRRIIGLEPEPSSGAHRESAGRGAASARRSEAAVAPRGGKKEARRAVRAFR